MEELYKVMDDLLEVEFQMKAGMDILKELEEFYMLEKETEKSDARKVAVLMKGYLQSMKSNIREIIRYIVVGGSPVDSIQYELIDKQFDCMAKYLSWDMLFKKSYYATARDELEKNKDSMNELEGIGKNL